MWAYLLALVFMGLPFIGAYLLTRRRPPDTPGSPVAFGMPYDDVQFRARDGVLLRGWWIPARGGARTPTIVQCAGQNGSMNGDLPTALFLHAAGYNVLMFDYRAHGRSAGRHVTFGLAEANDLRGALDYLETAYGVQSVGVIGFSMGALVTLNVARTDQRIQVAVCDGVTGSLASTLAQWLLKVHVPRLVATVFAQVVVWLAGQRTRTPMWTVDGVTWAAQVVDVPVLYVHGAQDHLISMADLYRLRHNLAANALLWVVPGCDHREAFTYDPERYRARVLEWFAQHLSDDMV